MKRIGVGMMADIKILYEDNHLLIVEKPVNIPVQADSSGDKDFLTMLKEDIKMRYNKPGNVYLALVHRLDRPVGGVMLFAKTSKAASRISNEIRKQAMERKYLAVVEGTPKKKSGELNHFLYKDKEKNIVHAVGNNHPQAKRAILHYEVVATSKGFSLLSVELYTGRPHQIRVQLAENGTPLYGDQKYGSKNNRPGMQIALWAHQLTVKHPTKDEQVHVVSEPPFVYPWKPLLEA